MARKTIKAQTGADAAPAVTQPAAVKDVFICSHLHKGIIFNLPDDQKVRIAGINDRLRGREKGIIPASGGIYTKVSAEAWEAIKTAFQDFPAIKNGLIYAETTAGRAKAAIREKADLKDGFAPVDPEKTRTQEAKGGDD